MINRISVCKFFLMLFTLMSSQDVCSMELLSYKESAKIVLATAGVVGASNIIFNASKQLIDSNKSGKNLLHCFKDIKGSLLRHGLRFMAFGGLPLGGAVACAARCGSWPKMEFSDFIKPIPLALGAGLCSTLAILHVRNYLQKLTKSEKCTKLGMSAACVKGCAAAVPLSMLGLAGYCAINRYRMS